MDYNRPELVVLSVERYAELKAAAERNDPLRRLRDEFDREMAILRKAGVADRLRQIFAADPVEIADAANATAPRDDE